MPTNPEINYAPQRWPAEQCYVEQRYTDYEGNEFSVFTHINGQDLTREDMDHLKLVAKNTEVMLGRLDWPKADFPIATLTNEPLKQKQTRIYLMLNRRNGYWKIGHSTTPKHRERTLQAEDPDIYLVESALGTVKDEEHLHSLYKAKRVRGEWFALCQEDVAAIKDYFTSIDKQ